jgi:hypothetical protein
LMVIFMMATCLKHIVEWNTHLCCFCQPCKDNVGYCYTTHPYFSFFLSPDKGCGVAWCHSMHVSLTHLKCIYFYKNFALKSHHTWIKTANSDVVLSKSLLSVFFRRN